MRQANRLVGHLVALRMGVVAVHQLVDPAMPIHQAQAHTTRWVAQCGHRPQHSGPALDSGLRRLFQSLGAVDPQAHMAHRGRPGVGMQRNQVVVCAGAAQVSASWPLRHHIQVPDLGEKGLGHRYIGNVEGDAAQMADDGRGVGHGECGAVGCR